MKVLNIADNDYGFYPIGAINIIEFKGFKFFSHRSVDGEGYCVSEYTTGFKFLHTADIDSCDFLMSEFFKSKFKSESQFKTLMNDKIDGYVADKGISNQ